MRHITPPIGHKFNYRVKNTYQIHAKIFIEVLEAIWHDAGDAAFYNSIEEIRELLDTT